MSPSAPCLHPSASPVSCPWRPFLSPLHPCCSQMSYLSYALPASLLQSKFPEASVLLISASPAPRRRSGTRRDTHSLAVSQPGLPPRPSLPACSLMLTHSAQAQTFACPCTCPCLPTTRENKGPPTHKVATSPRSSVPQILKVPYSTHGMLVGHRCLGSWTHVYLFEFIVPGLESTVLSELLSQAPLA